MRTDGPCPKAVNGKKYPAFTILDTPNPAYGAATVKLHRHQVETLDAARRQIRAGYRRLLIQGETGSGKTVQAAFMLDGAARRGMPSLFLTHRRELIRQASRTFDAAGIPHGVIANGFAADPAQLVQVGSIQTVLKNRASLRRPKFMIFDECQHIAAAGWSEFQDTYPDAFQIGLSASPIRLDGKCLGEHFDVMVRGPSVRWLQKRGFLAKYIHYAPACSLDTSNIRKQAGDYHRGDLAAAVEISMITEEAVTAYRRLGRGRRTIIFCSSIENSLNAVASFQAAGFSGAHIDGTTSASERDLTIERFARGEISTISNVDLLGEGFDVPGVECVILLRPTLSLSLYLQMIGRCLRTSPGKTDAIVLDLVRNYARHGLADEDRDWSLEPQPRAKLIERSDLLVCAACDAVAAHRSFCDVCGAPPKPHRVGEIATWNALVNEPGLAATLRGMSYGSAIRWADSEEKVRLVAMARGFKSGWAWYRSRELNGATP